VKIEPNPDDYIEALDHVEIEAREEIVTERTFFKSFDNNLNKRIEMV